MLHRMLTRDQGTKGRNNLCHLTFNALVLKNMMLKSASSWLHINISANKSSKTQHFEHFLVLSVHVAPVYLTVSYLVCHC